MDKKKGLIIGGVILGAALVYYFVFKKKSRKSGAGSHGGTGGGFVGKTATIIPFGEDGTSGEEDYDGTIYDGITHTRPDRNSSIDSKIPQGTDISYDILDQSGDWVYIFSEISSPDIYTGWIPSSAVNINA